MASHHTTTIVVDFDDTLALTKTREWSSAAPNVPLINKLNKLYDRGWDIHVVTARGQLSCNGDCAAADLKYRDQITKWLNDHGVNFTSLSFQKKLAAYYIDDKGCTPEHFVEHFVDRVQLRGGWSGAKVEYDSLNEVVYKTATNTLQAVKWFEYASALGYRTPKIHTVIGDTIKMEYLESIQLNRRSASAAIELALSFNGQKHLYQETDYSAYVKRCMNRAVGVFNHKEIQLIEKLLTDAGPYTPFTFSHGDFGVENLLPMRDGIYMIDPIAAPDLYSSYVIDLGKLYATARLKDRQLADKIAQELTVEKKIMPDWLLSIHAVAHLLRMHPYASVENKQLIFSEIQSLVPLNYAL